MSDMEKRECVVLSLLFRCMWDGEAGRVSEQALNVMRELKLIEVAPNGFVSLTLLGRAALTLSSEAAD